MITSFLNPDQIMKLQDVLRWHTRHTLREQTVAGHSCAVAHLAIYLAPSSTNTEDRLQLLQLALLHDAHEAFFGDTPYPAKQAYKFLGHDVDAIGIEDFWGTNDPHAQVLPHVRLIVEVADILEAALFAQKYLPDIAAKIVQDAIDAAKGLGNDGLFKVLDALGVTK